MTDLTPYEKKDVVMVLGAIRELATRSVDHGVAVAGELPGLVHAFRRVLDAAADLLQAEAQRRAK